MSHRLSVQDPQGPDLVGQRKKRLRDGLVGHRLYVLGDVIDHPLGRLVERRDLAGLRQQSAKCPGGRHAAFEKPTPLPRWHLRQAVRRPDDLRNEAVATVKAN